MGTVSAEPASGSQTPGHRNRPLHCQHNSRRPQDVLWGGLPGQSDLLLVLLSLPVTKTAKAYVKSGASAKFGNFPIHGYPGEAYNAARNAPAPRKRILLQKYTVLRKPLTVILLYSYISNPKMPAYHCAAESHTPDCCLPPHGQTDCIFP